MSQYSSQPCSESRRLAYLDESGALDKYLQDGAYAVNLALTRMLTENYFMSHKDYPPDASVTGGLKTVSYSVNSEGEYELVSGTGWQPVNVVNRQAWVEIEKSIVASREKIDAGRVSCLHYYMTANQMDPGLLARYTNQSRWQVRLHLVPFFYRRLGRQTLQKYAELFQISIDDLENGRLKAPVYDLTKQAQQPHE